MINNKKVLGVVPARSGSKGLKDKNILNFLDIPLMLWPLNALKDVEEIDMIHISTDSKKYAEIAINAGFDVPFLRPKNISGDESSSIDVLLYILDRLKDEGNVFEYVVMLEPTSPLTLSKNIKEALNKLDQNKDTAESIISIGEVVDYHPSFCLELDQDNKILPLEGFDNFLHKRRQDLKKLYHLDGSFYISKVNALYKNKSFYHPKTIGMVMPKFQNTEIDTVEDFIIAENIAKNLL